MLKLLTVTALALGALTCPTYAACFVPAAPSCVNDSTPFATDTEATNCYTEFTAYFEAMKANDTCLNSEIDAFVETQKAISNNAWTAYDQALTAYNRRAGT